MQLGCLATTVLQDICSDIASFAGCTQAQTCFVLFHTMYSKNAFLTGRDSEQPEKRLRSNLADLYLAGAVSGQRAASLFADADAAGASHVDDLKVTEGGNSHRDLRRKILKGTCWPPLYTLQVPVLHQKTHQTTFEEMNILLPHEVAAVVAQRNPDCPEPFAIRGLSIAQQQNFLRKVSQLQISNENVMPLGLWADGCPVKWDRSESVLVVSLNWPGQTLDQFSRVRVPLCATWFSIWSFFIFSKV